MNIPVFSILLFGISGGEIFIIVLLILVFFGPKRIPEIARTLGKGINEIKKVQRDINAEINRYSDELEKPVKQVQEDIEGFSKDLNKATDLKSDNDVPSDIQENENKNKPEIISDEDLPYPYSQNYDDPEEPSESQQSSDDKEEPSDSEQSDDDKEK